MSDLSLIQTEELLKEVFKRNICTIIAWTRYEDQKAPAITFGWEFKGVGTLSAIGLTEALKAELLSKLFNDVE